MGFTSPQNGPVYGNVIFRNSNKTMSLVATFRYSNGSDERLILNIWIN